MDVFVAQHFPHLHPLYLGYPSGIYRSDLFRLLVCYQMGGVYADLDAECLVPLNDLIDRINKSHGQPLGNPRGNSVSLVFACEHAGQAEWSYGFKPIYHAFFMFSAAGNPILKALIDSIVAKGDARSGAWLLAVTGPLAITDFFRKNPEYAEQVTFLDDKVVSPIVNFSAPLPPWIYRDSLKMLISGKFYPETAVVHYWYNSHVPDGKKISRLRDRSPFHSKERLSRQLAWSQNPLGFIYEILVIVGLGRALLNSFPKLRRQLRRWKGMVTRKPPAYD
jgi:hypothetical protein